MLNRFILALFLLTGSLLHAQPRFNVGFQAGGALTTIPGFSNSGMSKLTVTGGMIITRRDNNRNYAQVEINYIQKGGIRRAQDDNPDRVSLTLHYVEVPLLYRWENLKVSRNGTGGLEAGLSFARLLAPVMRRNGDQVALNPIVMDYYDLSLLGGVHFLIGQHFMIRSRLSWSINPILRRNILPNEITNFSSPRTHNICLQFGIAWFIREKH
ncbi:MAG TPA: porin family protein [Bacteroidia bacterium]|nr:porin family protein [Bacteroidia bacterium]